MLFGTLSTGAKMPFPMLVGESVTTTIRTIKLAHVENIAHLTRHLHFLPFLFAKGTDSVSGQPLSEA